MNRPAFYFKLQSEIRLNQSLTGAKSPSYYFIGGHVMKRRSPWVPAWMDEECLYLTESYDEASEYKNALLKIEAEAFKTCEKLCQENEALEAMMETHKANLKKLNLGYKLIGWFQGMGDLVQGDGGKK